MRKTQFVFWKAFLTSAALNNVSVASSSSVMVETNFLKALTCSSVLWLIALIICLLWFLDITGTSVFSNSSICSIFLFYIFNIQHVLLVIFVRCIKNCFNRLSDVVDLNAIYKRFLLLQVINSNYSEKKSREKTLFWRTLFSLGRILYKTNRFPVVLLQSLLNTGFVLVLNPYRSNLVLWRFWLRYKVELYQTFLCILWIDKIGWH